MRKYFITQVKRILGILPAILLVAALLYGGLDLAYRGLIVQWNQSDEFQKVNIGIVGTDDDYYLELGMKAVQSMDSSKFTVSFIPMEEKQAKKALESGQIDAYIYFPPEFVEDARRGFVTPLQFVSAAGNENILSLVKEELTTALDDVLLSSERASFGIYDALVALGEEDIAHQKRNELAVSLAAQMLNRQSMYHTDVLGVANGQSFDQYMFCGILTVFLFMLSLPFVRLYVRDNTIFEQHMKSRGIGGVAQVISEITAYFLSLLLIVLIMLTLLSGFTVQNILTAMAVVLALTSFSYLLYSIVKEIITGVLLQFVVVIAMCFIAGCMYPVYFFPISLQKIGTILPPAMVRNCISGIFYKTDCSFAVFYLLAMSAACIALSVLVRMTRIHGGRRGIA